MRCPKTKTFSPGLLVNRVLIQRERKRYSQIEILSALLCRTSPIGHTIMLLTGRETSVAASCTIDIHGTGCLIEIVVLAAP